MDGNLERIFTVCDRAVIIDHVSANYSYTKLYFC